MKVLQTSQDFSSIDSDWIHKSQNHKTFSFSRIYLIKTENDFKAISANLIDRIIACVLTIFGNTYESYFAKKLEVKSVQILDDKAGALEALNTLKVPKPPVDKPAEVQEASPVKPIVATQPVDKPPVAAPETGLLTLVDQQHWMTDEQKIFTKKIMQKIPAEKPGFFIPVQLGSFAEKGKEVLDFLLLNGTIVAWANCAYYHPYAALKIKANDCVDLEVGRGVFRKGEDFIWRERQFVETERAFQEKNKIKFSNSFFRVLEKSSLTREQLLALAELVSHLNNGVTSGPCHLFSSFVHDKECLEFMVNRRLIHSFEVEIATTPRGDVYGAKLIIQRAQESVNPQPAYVQTIVQTILQQLSTAKPGFIISFQVNLPSTNEQKEIMDDLLLQGAIAAWSHGRGNFIYAKINTADQRYQDGIPSVFSDWRELQDVMSDRKFQEMNAIRLRLEHLKLIKDSTLNREQIIALDRLVKLLNERFRNGSYKLESNTANETAGLEFMKANGLIHDYELEETKDQEGKHDQTEYTIYVTPADIKKPKA